MMNMHIVDSFKAVPTCLRWMAHAFCTIFASLLAIGCSDRQLGPTVDDVGVLEVHIAADGSISHETRGFMASVESDGPVRVRVIRSNGHVLMDVRGANINEMESLLSVHAEQVWAETKNELERGLRFLDDIDLETMNPVVRDYIDRAIATAQDKLDVLDGALDASLSTIDSLACDIHATAQDRENQCSKWEIVKLMSSCVVCVSTGITFGISLRAIIHARTPQQLVIAITTALVAVAVAILSCDDCASKARACNDVARETEARETLDVLRRQLDDLQRRIDELGRCVANLGACVPDPH